VPWAVHVLDGPLGEGGIMPGVPVPGLLLLAGLAKKLFAPLALTVAVAMIASYFVSMMVTPVACRYFFGHAEHGRIGKAVEVGHIFKLGRRYTESMGARVLDRNGKEVTLIMGCYGIGIERILTAAVEQSNDENGFWLPPSIAPFEIVVCPVNVKDETLLKAATDIAARLEADGFDVLLDDRDERPGVKFKDADLVGIPFRVTVGKKVTEGTVEVVRRSTREIQDASIAAITDYFRALRPAR